MLLSPLSSSQQSQVRHAVIVDEEHVLAVVPTLSNVVRAVGYHDSSNSEHSPIILIRTISVNPKNRVAVGTPVARRPPHRSVREELPHTALTSGSDDQRPRGYTALRFPVRPTIRFHAFPALCPARVGLE
jgi:hypothetical protein